MSPELFISYAWDGESERIVNLLDAGFQERGLTIIRDKRDLGYKGRIKEFMEHIGKGKCVIVVLSEKYLQSENCMFELLEISKNNHFYDRIFPIVLADAVIYKAIHRLRYIKYWEDRIAELDAAIKQVGSADLQGIREDIDLYTRIRAAIASLTDTIKNMNTLTPEMHENTNFAALFEAVQAKIAEDNKEFLTEISQSVEKQVSKNGIPVATNNNDLYDFWNPVVPPHFVGRKKHLQVLENALIAGRSVSLIGDWRIGKTSLLKTFAQQTQAAGRCVVFINGKTKEAQSLHSFVETIIQSTTNWQATADPDRSADILLRWAESQPQLPLLLLDEIETCFKLFPPRFFERLRGMLDKLVLIMAAEEDINTTYRTSGQSSPFSNRVEIVRLSLLDAEATEELVKKGAPVFNENDQQNMLLWAGTHPFYLQMIGYFLVEVRRAGAAWNTEVEDKIVDQAAPHLSKIWETLNEKEQQTLRESLQGKSVSLRSLRLRGLVTEEGKLFGQVLREWLLQNS